MSKARMCWTLVVAVGLSAAAQAMPAAGQGPHAPHTAASTPARKVDQQRPAVDINSAPVSALKTLPGIGDAEARRIVAGRPYLSKAELVTKRVLPEGPYTAIRRHIIAKQNPKALAQQKA